MKVKVKISFLNFIFRTLILFSLLFILGCDLIPNDNTVEYNSKAIIVTVDGLSFANTLVMGTAVIQNSNDYLKVNLKKIINSKLIRSYTWSGDAEDTAAILSSSDSGIRKFFLDNYQEAKETGKAFIVVCHSWGTFLSYVALSLEPTIECDLFITLSSPLGTASGLPDSPEKIVRDFTDAKLAELLFDISGIAYPDTKLFYNFWANGDLISGPLSGKIPASLIVHDVKIDQVISDYRYITDAFFWHKFTALGEEVVTDITYQVYLISIGILDISPTRDVFINQVTDLIQTASGY
ncbi:MAG: hypothetical protein JXB50_14010 [Spirochaetes bacterium]|nr:hypothetical protein [Spirochaetota bacterium]